MCDNSGNKVQLTYNNIAHAVAFYVIDFAAEDDFISADELFSVSPVIRYQHMLEDLVQLSQISKMIAKGTYIAEPLDKESLDTLAMLVDVISKIHNTPIRYVQALSSLTTRLSAALKNTDIDSIEKE